MPATDTTTGFDPSMIEMDAAPVARICDMPGCDEPATDGRRCVRHPFTMPAMPRAMREAIAAVPVARQAAPVPFATLIAAECARIGDAALTLRVQAAMAKVAAGDLATQARYLANLQTRPAGPQASTAPADTASTTPRAVPVQVAPVASVPVPTPAPAPAPVPVVTEPTLMERVAAERARRTAAGLSPIPSAQEVRERTANRVAPVADPVHGGSSTAQTADVRDVVPVARPLITRDNLVAGAADQAVGALIGWSGSGQLSRRQILNTLRDAGLPESWAPAAKSAHAQASEAVERLNGAGLVARAERKGKLAPGQRGYRARWVVGAAHTSGNVGEDLGTIVLTVTLWEDQTIRCQGDQALCDRVLGDFARLTEADLYQAGDVTEWLRDVMRTRWAAVRLGGTWYIPRRYVQAAQALCESLAARGWGNDWIVPPLPVTTSEGLKTGLARGLIQEANAVITEWREAVERNGGKVGEKSAARVLTKLGEVTERAKGYAAVLGGDHVREVQATLAKLRTEIEPHVSETAQRGALIWEEIR